MEDEADGVVDPAAIEKRAVAGVVTWRNRQYLAASSHAIELTQAEDTGPSEALEPPVPQPERGGYELLHEKRVDVATEVIGGPRLDM